MWKEKVRKEFMRIFQNTTNGNEWMNYGILYFIYYYYNTYLYTLHMYWFEHINIRREMETHLWYWFCKKLNSSLMRSQLSNMVSLNGWFGCCGPFKIDNIRKLNKIIIKITNNINDKHD